MLRACLTAGSLGLNVFLWATLLSQPVSAQNIVVDGSLGPAEDLAGPFYSISQELGTTAGENLFHSFELFNLDVGEIAVFESDLNIQNILSRVTGGALSFLDGEIFTTSSDVNFFLINPSGIIFGPNAKLDIGGPGRGAFVATTVDALLWPDGGQFNAVNVGDAQGLLNLVGEPNEFFASQRPLGSIRLEGTVLNVASGQSLLLLGGDVSAVDSDLLVNPGLGGRVEVAGLEAVGTIALAANGNDLSLQFPAGVARGDLSFVNTFLDVRAENGGSLSFYGDDVSILEGSVLAAGIVAGFEDLADAQAGHLKIDAAGTLSVASSLLFNDVSEEGLGNAGDVLITAAELRVSDGSEVGSRAFGQGNAGTVEVVVSEGAFFQGTSFDGALPTALYSQVESGAVGQAGDVIITAPVLEVTDGAVFATRSFGDGDAGSVMVEASDRVIVSDFASVSSLVGDKATGQGGDVVIRTPALEVFNGASVQTQTFGEGDAGRVILEASDRVIVGDFASVSSSASGVVGGEVGNKVTGWGGDVFIRTPVLEVFNGASIGSNTFGEGDAGSVSIDASERIISNADGDARRTAISSSVAFAATGQGGDVVIRTPVLDFRQGSITTATLGEGDAGTVSVDAFERVVLNDSIVSSTTGELSLSASIGEDVVVTGKGGNVIIRTPVLEILKGAGVRADTFEDGDAGRVSLNVSDRLLIDGTNPTVPGQASEISTTNGVPVDEFVRLNGEGDVFTVVAAAASQGVGAGGEINITAPQLTIRNGARINARTFNDSPGGDIKLVGLDQLTLDRGRITVSSAGAGDGGNITIESRQAILLKDGSTVETNVGLDPSDSGDLLIQAPFLMGGFLNENGEGSLGNGGNIEIETPFLIGFPNENNDIIANAIGGNGGQINITASSILNFGIQDGQNRSQLRSRFSNDISASSETGLRGSITLDTPDVDPADNLAELPVDFVDGSRLIAQDLCRDGEGSEFIVTGRGGLPPAPQDVFQPEAEWEDWRISLEQVALESNPKQRLSGEAAGQKTSLPGSRLKGELPSLLPLPQLQEAQGWVRSPTGQIQLIPLQVRPVVHAIAQAKPFSPVVSCQHRPLPQPG